MSELKPKTRRSMASSQTPADESKKIFEEIETMGDVSFDGSTQMTITWGAETVQAVQYNSFQIGPFAMTVTIGKGVDPLAAYHTARAKLEAIAKEEFRTKLDEHLDHIRKAQAGRVGR